MAKLPKEITDEIYQAGYEKGFSDGYDKANATFELEYYQGHTLGEAYSDGKLDGARDFAKYVIDKIDDGYITHSSDIVDVFAEWQKGREE